MNETFTEVTYNRRPRNSNSSFSVDGRTFQTGRPNEGKIIVNDIDFSDDDDDDDNIEDIILQSPIVWHKFALIGDIHQPIEELLRKYNISACSVCGTMVELINTTIIPNCQWNHAFSSESDWINFSNQSGRGLKFISIIPNFTPREYGRKKKLYFVHVRFDQYFLAENNPEVVHNINLEGYFGFLGDKPTHVPVSVVSDIGSENRTNFMRIMKIVDGKMKHDKFQEDGEEPTCDADSRPYYDPLSKEDLTKYKKRIYKCQLHLEDGFSGYGIILDEKYLDLKVYLYNRRNCFQAFNKDIVNIMVFTNEKSNEPDIKSGTSSGRVISVQHSDVKPINKIFLCTVSFGQANFMIPICGTIPTIEVDNIEAKERVKRNCGNLIDGLSDVSGIENLLQRRVNPDKCKNFADKCFVTIKVLRDDLTTSVDRIQYIDCFRCDFIFLVLYKEWNINRRFPFGEVVGLYTPDASFSKTFPLIAVSCDLSVVSVAKENELNVEMSRLITEIKESSLEDIYQNRHVFSFKYPNQPFNEIAYSYESINETSFKLGIHVVNVQKFIKRGHLLYDIALKQFFTYLPPVNRNVVGGTKPLYLFSEKITNEILTISDNRPIDVISFYFTVDFSEKDVYKVDNRTIMRFERLKLTEEIDVDEVDRRRITESYLQNIYMTCIKHRIKRINSHHIPDSWFYPDYSFKINMASSLISNELEIMVNKFVKDLLSEHPGINFPVCVGKNITHNTNFINWMDMVKEICTVSCFPTLGKCFTSPVRITQRKSIRISQQFLENVLKEDKVNLLKCDMLFPDVSFFFYKLVNIVSWESLTTRANAGQSPFTVSITKPLSCFNDLLIQTMMVGCRNNTNNEYSSDDIDEICRKYKDNLIIFDRYWTISRGYEVKDKFSDVSFVLDCVFDGVTEESIFFHHPFLKDVSHDNYILFERMGLSKVTLPPKCSNPELEWFTKIFIYEDKVYDRFYNIPFIISDIYSHNLTDLREKIFSSGLNPQDRDKLSVINSNRNYPLDLTSELSRNMDPELILILKLQERQILRIQFNYDYNQGVMKIVPELLILNPHLRACLCHRNDPFKFFIHPNNLSRINYQRFSCFYQYKEQFRILNRIEAIDQTISERASYFIHDVKITWIGTKAQKDESMNRTPPDDVYGVVILELAWCEERFLRFGHKNLRIKDPVNTLNKAVEFCHMEFLACIQSFMSDKNVYWLGHAEVSDVAYIGGKDHKLVHLTLKLTHSNFPIKPLLNQLYSLEIMEIPITARILDRSMRMLKTNSFVEKVAMDRISNDITYAGNSIDYNMEVKMFMQFKYDLNDAQTKALNIAIKRDFSLIWGPPGTGKTMVGCIIAFAFTQINKRSRSNGESTVLYCGPSNQSVNVVADKLIRTFGKNRPKMLRIFSSDVLNVDFPYPSAIVNGDLGPTPDYLKEIALHHIIRQDGKPYCEVFKDFSKYFKEHEFRGKSDRNEYSKVVQKYHKTLKRAYKEEVKSGGYEIVLCTTVGSCRKLLDDLNITQLIIDEAGMCSEMEAIGPIAKKGLQNTVLIGDHKQLRPIITSEAAKGKQLNQSLFERIYDPTRPYCTMLDTQYRMHPSICEFPSTYLYEGANAKLMTALCPSWTGIPDSCILNRNEFNGLEYKGLKTSYKTYLLNNNITIADGMWKGTRQNNFKCYPYDIDGSIKEKILFINAEGYESNQVVSGATGSEKSKGNDEEVKAVGRLYEGLIKKITNKDIARQSILVITQYRLQEYHIKMTCSDILKKYNIHGPPRVSTVVTSQGSECDYVIFSTVRSLPNLKDIDINPSPGWIAKYLGFITDKNQFNVAITRAKKGLFIIGNSHLLSVNQNWKSLIQDLKNRRCWANNIFDVL